MSYLAPEENAGQQDHGGTTMRSLQTEQNAVLVRLEHDLIQRLGEHTVYKLSQSGLELVQLGRQALLRLAAQIGQAFALEEGGLQPQVQYHRYSNAQRPRQVEDGYACVQLCERQIVRHFLQQRQIYRALLENLASAVVHYIEKMYYRIEQRWQEFQSHYSLVTQDLQDPQDLHSNESPSHNRSQSEHELRGQSPPSTAAQIAQRHRRMQQLRVIARSFWQDHFAQGLEQLQLDWGELAGGEDWPDDVPDVPDVHKATPLRQNTAGGGELLFPQVCYVSFLRELEAKFGLLEWKRNLFERLHTHLRQSLAAQQLFVDTPPTENKGHLCHSYTEFTQKDLPDEFVNLEIRYADGQWLQHHKDSQEKKLAWLSQGIHDFFVAVEKRTRFGHLQAILLWCQKKKTTQNFAIENDAAIAELLARMPEDSKASSHELAMLLELLQKADIALQYQQQFCPTRHCYQLQEQRKDLRCTLLHQCRSAECKPLIPIGITIRAQYRTVRRRRESYRRLHRALQEFVQICHSL